MTNISSLNRVPLESFKITNEDLLGEGSFGIVYKGTWKEQTVAIKKLRAQKDIPERELKLFENEASIMQACESERITKLFGVCMVERNYALILEYMEGGSLFSLLQGKKPLSWDQRWSIAEDIGEGLAYLHSKKIIHGELTSYNVLMDKDFRAKLSDFGQAKMKVYISTKTDAKTSVGIARWRAPEQIPPKAQEPAKPSDVYSFGVVLWEIASRKIPYSSRGNDEVGPHIKGQNTENRPESCSDSYWAVIKERCWKYKPEERFSIEAVLEELRKQAPLPQDEEARTNMLRAKVQEIDKALQACMQEKAGAEKLKNLQARLVSLRSDYETLKEAHSDDIDEQKAKIEEIDQALKIALQNQQVGAKRLGAFQAEVGALNSVAKEETISAEESSFREDKVRDLIGANFFGREEWTKYIGEVENVPPLPVDIEQILQSPCPYFSGKKIGESHLLTLIPEQVRGVRLTLRTFEEMITTPKEGGHAVGYRCIPSIKKKFGESYLERAQWMLLSRDVIPGSRKERYEAQQTLLSRGSRDFEVPHLLDAIVAIAAHYVATGERLYVDKPCTFTRCQERVSDFKLPCNMGGFASSGFHLACGSRPDIDIGVGSARKF